MLVFVSIEEYVGSSSEYAGGFVDSEASFEVDAAGV